MTTTFTDQSDLRLVGENPWMMVYQDTQTDVSTNVSVWTVTLSPVGPGHTLFWYSELTDGKPRIYSDNIALTRWLQDEILGAQFPYKDVRLPVSEAKFTRQGSIPSFLTERVEAPGEVMEFTWFDFLPAFVRATGEDVAAGRTHAHYASYVPAKQIRAALNGKEAKGAPRSMDRDGWKSSSCFVALAESWLRPKP